MIVNTHAIEPQVCVFFSVTCILQGLMRTIVLLMNLWFLQSLVEFFGTLSREWALECMKDLLVVNLRGNLQIIVQV